MIKKINSKQALEILEKKEPRGLFYYKLGRIYLGIDNSLGYAWTKRFKKLKLCKKWLIGY
jgi:hypothetical protein